MELKDCFVIMPFSNSETHTEQEWTEIFEHFFKPAWNSFNIDCHRTNVPRGSITEDIIERLLTASIVFADLTDLNPNVMYELGVRHTFKKPSVMVKAKGSQIPFDVNVYKIFEYQYTPKGSEELKNYISSVIEHIQRNPNKPDNPVWNYRSSSDFLMDYYRNRDSIQKLTALTVELNSNLNRCNALLDKIKELDLSIDYVRMNQRDQSILDEGISDFFLSIQNEALTQLRITMYIDFGKEHWDLFNQIDGFYKWCSYYVSNLAVAEFSEDGRERIKNIREVIQEAANVVTARIDGMKKESPL
jgi:hypothetical protein